MASPSETMCLKETIAMLEKRVKELESSGGESSKADHKNSKAVGRLSQRQSKAIQVAKEDTVEKPVPTYEQLFHFPLKKSDRDPSLLYGKEFLAKYYVDSVHAVHCSNLRTVRGWMKAFDSKLCDLRHNLEGKDELMNFIQEHHDEIEEVMFRGSEYHWKVEDIYTFCLRHRQANRKNEKKKSTLVNTTNLISIEENNLQPINEEVYHPHIDFEKDQNYSEAIITGVQVEALLDVVEEEDEALASNGSFLALIEDVTKSVLKNVLNESVTLQNTKAFNELSNGSHEYDMNFDKDDQETILIKFLEVPTVDALYITLKASFNLAKRSTDFTGDRQEQSVDGMRSSFVVYLLATNKVRISKCDSSPLSVDDVIVVE
ncbi:hypothetical protein GOP47_0006549 [Adiantum capillus-veneris]|uniref:Uncharacterized protein n=1 Tax=Adiantum capillus-veneris TaxID=13818 RepID=A0A9D4ZKE0_ADICA|nr:hypothetical protein GOP47_0006549 [Adiantum capillus-veneris]